MNKKHFAFVLGMTAVLGLFCCKSGTSPGQADELATYAGSLQVLAVYDSGNLTMKFTFTYQLTNTNNIGGDVDKVVHSLYYQNTAITEQTYYPATSVRISAGGNYSWEITEEYNYVGYSPDTAIVLITLTDDNGNEQTFSTGSVAIAWTMI